MLNAVWPMNAIRITNAQGFCGDSINLSSVCGHSWLCLTIQYRISVCNRMYSLFQQWVKEQHSHHSGHLCYQSDLRIISFQLHSWLNHSLSQPVLLHAAFFVVKTQSLHCPQCNSTKSQHPIHHMRGRVWLCVLHMYFLYLMHVYCVFLFTLGPHTSQHFFFFLFLLAAT